MSRIRSQSVVLTVLPLLIVLDSASIDSGWRAESICALEWVHRESENADPVDNVAKPPYLDAACSSKPLFVHAGDAVE